MAKCKKVYVEFGATVNMGNFESERIVFAEEWELRKDEYNDQAREQLYRQLVKAVHEKWKELASSSSTLRFPKSIIEEKEESK